MRVILNFDVNLKEIIKPENITGLELLERIVPVNEEYAFEYDVIVEDIIYSCHFAALWYLHENKNNEEDIINKLKENFINFYNTSRTSETDLDYKTEEDVTDDLVTLINFILIDLSSNVEKIEKVYNKKIDFIFYHHGEILKDKDKSIASFTLACQLK